VWKDVLGRQTVGPSNIQLVDDSSEIHLHGKTRKHGIKAIMSDLYRCAEYRCSAILTDVCVYYLPLMDTMQELPGVSNGEREHNTEASFDWIQLVEHEQIPQLDGPER
jgi:hypothetical protein